MTPFKSSLLLLFTFPLFSSCHALREEPLTTFPDFRVPVEDLHTRTFAAITPCLHRLESIFDVRWPRTSGGFPSNVELSIVNSERREGYAHRGRIVLSRAALYAGPGYYETTLCHEMIHLFQKRFFSAYDTIPSWQREGFAVYASNQLRLKRYNRIAYASRFPDTLQSVPHSGQLPLNRYMEAAMVFEYLHFQLQNRWTDFLRAWRRSSDLNRVLKRFLGQSESEVLRRAHVWSRLRFETIKSRLGSHYWEAQRLGSYQASETHSLLSSVLESVSTEFKTPSEAFSAVLLLKSCRLLRRFEEASKLSDILLRTPVWMHGDQTAEILAQTGYVEHERGTPENALPYFQRVLAFHPEHAILRDSMKTTLGRAYFDAEDYELALFWLRHYQSNGTYVDEEIQTRIEVARFMLGEIPRESIERLRSSGISRKSQRIIDEVLRPQESAHTHAPSPQ